MTRLEIEPTTSRTPGERSTTRTLDAVSPEGTMVATKFIPVTWAYLLGWQVIASRTVSSSKTVFSESVANGMSLLLGVTRCVLRKAVETILHKMCRVH